MSNTETRFTTGIAVEKAQGMPTQIVGYPIVFNSTSSLIFDKRHGEFRERVSPAAVDRTLGSNADVRASVEHDPNRKLGRRKSGTVTLAKDDKGVRVAISIPDTTVGRDVVAEIERGEYDGMSFTFRTVKDQWTRNGGENLRELLDINFDEVAIVGTPAYPDTSVALRSYEAATSGERDAAMQHNRNKLRLADASD
jgi:HK97 family phage prohead protease